jgi:hypothetical protein
LSSLAAETSDINADINPMVAEIVAASQPHLRPKQKNILPIILRHRDAGRRELARLPHCHADARPGLSWIPKEATVPDWLRQILSSEYFVPHGHCYLWKPGMLTLHALANVLIAFSCFAIAATLFLARQRSSAAARPVHLVGVAFLLTLGLTHLLAVVVIWNPIYWVEGGLRALAALAAVVTAVTLPRLFGARATNPEHS